MGEAKSTRLRITKGELSRRTGVNSENIRYYEKVGMLAAPPRTSGGHRVYDEDHVRVLTFIHHARQLGFKPNEVRAILGIGGPASACCDDVRDIAAHHLQQVRSKMAALAEIESALARTISHCSGDHTPDCPVIDMIEAERPATADL